MATSYYSNEDDRPVKDEYYANDNTNDMWGGTLAEEVGLTGNVHHEEFEAMINNVYSRLKPLMRTGEEPTLGADLTFSSSKSVSLAIVNEPPEVSQTLQENHRRAVEDTLKIVEREFISKNISRQRLLDGNSREFTGHAIYAKFEHGLSRYKDVQTHTHCYIANETIDSTGKACSIDVKFLMENQKTIGAICRNLELKYNMESGFQFREGQHDFELVGYSDELIAENSKARLDIEKYLSDHGMEANAKNCQIAWNSIRPAKSEHANNRDIADNTREICNAHKAHISLIDNSHEVTMSEAEGEDVFSQTIKELQDKDFAFTKGELQVSLLNNGSIYGMSWEQCKDLIEKHKELVYVGMRQDSPASTKEYYTTKDNIRLQKEIEKHILACKGTGHKIASKDIEKAMERVAKSKDITLKGEQADFVKNFLASSSRAYVLNGKPGTGKTFVMAYAKDTLLELGYKPQDIQGAAFQKAAAIELEQDSGIKSDTIDRLLLMKEKEAATVRGEKWHFDGSHGRHYDFRGLPKLTRPAVLVVDEAGMVDDIKIKALFDYSKEVSTPEAPLTLLFSGDYRQIQAIGIGGGYEKMANREGGRVPPVASSYLEDITRQKDAELKETVLSIVNDESVGRSFQLLHQRSLEDTMKQWRQEPERIIKADNAAIAEDLNQRIRQERLQQGQLQNEQTIDLQAKRPTKAEPEPKPQQMKLAEGERVIISSAKTGANKDNYPGSSQTMTISRIKDGHIIGTAENGREYSIPTDKLRAGQIRYAYAVEGKQAGILFQGQERQYIEAHGGLREIRNHKELEKAAVDEYMRRVLSNDGKSLALSVETNTQRQRINRMIREQLQEAGKIEKKGYTFKVDNGQNPTMPDGKRNKSYKTQKIEVAKGDRLICLKNDNKAGLYNNMEGTVQSINKDGKAKILTKDGLITADLKANTSWDYAHAKTVNKLQGATVDTIITIEDRSNRNAHFVAVSRARTEGVIFTTNRQRLEKAADEWANKVTMDSFKPPTTEQGEYKTPEQRAEIVREVREPTGAEIEKLHELELDLGHPLEINEIPGHNEPELPIIQGMDEKKELLKAYGQLGKEKLPFAIERAEINNESMAIDQNGKKYLFPASKWIDLPQDGKSMAMQLKDDFETLQRAKENPFIPRMQREALHAGARIIAAGQLAESNGLITPKIARSCEIPGIPGFKEANEVLDLPVKEGEKTVEFMSDKVLEVMTSRELSLDVLAKGHEIERDGGLSL
ncbi:putative relaxase (plasmid) [Selenomonas ruminantium subsp. lactilytica TAM6421]|uniref:Putative relaxase n=2 Tax=Selenomonas ruminantium TaxID=971 RepID=I0GVK2_SELRL|nr:putative relaxase [Selenomonas ruminantium subsp. lactilytica TAM6421]